MIVRVRSLNPYTVHDTSNPVSLVVRNRLVITLSSDEHAITKPRDYILNPVSCLLATNVTKEDNFAIAFREIKK